MTESLKDFFFFQYGRWWNFHNNSGTVSDLHLNHLTSVAASFSTGSSVVYGGFHSMTFSTLSFILILSVVSSGMMPEDDPILRLDDEAMLYPDGDVILKTRHAMNIISKEMKKHKYQERYSLDHLNLLHELKLICA